MTEITLDLSSLSPNPSRSLPNRYSANARDNTDRGSLVRLCSFPKTRKETIILLVVHGRDFNEVDKGDEYTAEQTKRNVAAIDLMQDELREPAPGSRPS
jgi:hypothetical protein